MNDDNIQRAAVPEHEKVVEEVQEESTFIDLDEDDIKDVTPITNDQVIEDFDEGAIGKDDSELSEAEKETKKAQGRINKWLNKLKSFNERDSSASIR